jgi:hypothetical protein
VPDAKIMVRQSFFLVRVRVTSDWSSADLNSAGRFPPGTPSKS